MIAIEGTMFVLLVVSHIYLRRSAAGWPPEPLDPPRLLIPTGNLALLLASALPMRLAEHAARDRRERSTRVWLLVTTLLGLGFLALRALEFASLGFQWSSGAYGSLVWSTLGLHTGHVVASVVETAPLIVLTFRRPVDAKTRNDVEMDALYWYFVVAAGVVVYALVFLLPRLT
jgi:heme/copper-type cytochrome/quinol oxidase subunit 3